MATLVEPPQQYVVRQQGEYRLPPGLDHNLVFYFFSRFRPGDPIHFFEYLTKHYGPAAYYSIGPEKVLFINDPDLIREVLVVQNDNFVKERTVERMKMLVGNGLITSDGPHWKRQRRMAQPAFHRQRIVRYGEVMTDFARRTRENWRAGEQRDISVDMMHTALRIVAKNLFDSDLESEVEELGAEVNAIMGIYNFLVVFPFADRLWERWPIPGLMRFRRARRRLDETVYRMVREHLDGRDRGDLLSMLIAARDVEDNSKMDAEQLRDEVMTILLAGYETVANGLTWTWYLLSQHPEIEARMHAEIDSALGGRLPMMDDLPRLKYVEQVFAEAMRLYPPAWAQGRRALKDFEIGPYRVPARTSVFLSQYIMHRNERYWDDPLRFDPDRHSPERKQGRHKFVYFPFGGGPHQCIGESFAWMEGVLVLATIAQRWKLRLVPGHPVDVQPLITLRPKFGMKMIVEPR